MAPVIPSIKSPLDKVSGAGLKPNDVLDTPVGAQGPPEVRYRAHVSFDTAYDILKTLEQFHNRRKAFVYISNGYDFDPFSETRKKNDEAKWKEMNPNAGSSSDNGGTGKASDTSDVNPFLQQGAGQRGLQIEAQAVLRQRPDQRLPGGGAGQRDVAGDGGWV